jgi:putative ATP-binding cassette transporter
MAEKKELETSPSYSWRQLFGSYWRLAKPFWVSEERRNAWGLLTLVVLLTLASVYLLVQFNTWNQEFYDAVQKFDIQAFWSLILKFCILAAFYILVGVFSQYFTLVLQNRWRRWMTHYFLKRWLSEKSHYLWQLTEKITDNPDQRIAEDVRDFVSQSLGLSLGLLNQIVTLASFVTILWTLSGPLSVPYGNGHSFLLPGYMAWVCLVYAIIGTWISHRIGKPLIDLNYDQQRFEADFRFGLVRLRENAESVALSEGELIEQHSLKGLFEWAYSNFQRLIRKQMHWIFSRLDMIRSRWFFLTSLRLHAISRNRLAWEGSSRWPMPSVR